MQSSDSHEDPQIEVAKLKQELAAERERYLRLAADFDNQRKRASRELDRRAASQMEALVRDLLPSLDNFERALSARGGEELRQGVKMIYHQVLDTLQSHGFERREDLGQPFDGRFHHGIAVACRPELPDNSIIEVWERAWMRGSQMFRPAKVLVNHLREERTSSATD